MLRQTYCYVTDRLTGRAPKGAKRSPLWFETKKQHKKLFPDCAACGATKKLEVHHIKPFYLFPELELSLDNLVTLCHTCHIAFGHLYDYKAFNPEVKVDAHRFLEKVKNRCY